MDSESNHQFESRKADHIRLSLSDVNQARGLSGLDDLELTHEALPDIDFAEVDLASETLGRSLRAPFLISSMTAGHADSLALNRRLVEATERRGWCMGVGSQRRELNDPAAAEEWRAIRRGAKNAILFGNLGLSQLVNTSTDDVRRLTDAVEAAGVFIHLNALQECVQPEGTPRFRGGLRAIERLVRELDVPVIVKETGCGFSPGTLARVFDVGVRAVDVAGLGGTHWGRIEGGRAIDKDPVRAAAAQTLKNWGIPTVRAVADAVRLRRPGTEVWASGGVRSGLDAAKLLALGADLVGFAQPILEAAVRGDRALDARMEQLEFELRTVLFCTGVSAVPGLRNEKVWSWRSR